MKRLSILSLAVILVMVMSLGTMVSFAEGTDNKTDEAIQTAIEDVQTEVDETSLKEEAEEDIHVAKVKNVKAKGTSDSSIKITWSKVKGADGYKVLRYNRNKDSYKVIKTVKSGKTVKYTDKSLQSDTRKAYKVQAYVVDDGKKIKGKKSAKAVGKTKKSSVDKIMSVAKSKLGCSYCSGASGPNRFDCSGFVYYVYNKANVGKVKFSRSSAQDEYNQIKKYKVGSKASLAKRGDIIFFSASGSTSGINHVGIYAGNGKVIHAGSYSSGVCYGSVSKLSNCGRKVCAVVRIAK